MEFLSQPDLMVYKFENNTVKAHGREKSPFKQLFAGDRARIRYSMFLWKVILVFVDAV